MHQYADNGMTNIIHEHTVMKSSVLRVCILDSYVPLRLHLRENVLRMNYILIILHMHQYADNGMTNIIHEHTVMKSSVLRVCILDSYVPLRLHPSESVLRMNYVSHPILKTFHVQNDLAPSYRIQTPV